MSASFTSTWLALHQARTAQFLTSRKGVEREADLHEEIFAECRRRGWIVLHGSMAERTHRTAGEPDFIILADGGRWLTVECKCRTGKLSPAQFALKHHAEKLGPTIHVVRSRAEFLRLAGGQAGTGSGDGNHN